MDNRRIALIFLVIVFMIIPVHANATKGTLSDEAKMCLGCHSTKEMTRALESKEILSLYIDGKEFSDSIHNMFSCSGCHPDISMEKHPLVKKISSKKEYSKNASKVCKNCHPDQVLKKKPMHGSVVAQPKAPACAECHGSHDIKRIAELKAPLTESQYCLICHKYDFSIPLKSGEFLSLYADESVIRRSIHTKLQCGACHAGFSKVEHPIRVFKSKRDHSITATEGCGKCHPDAQEQYKGSIHHIVLRENNLKASVCIDCHGSHSAVKVDRNLGLISCDKCHGDVNAAYKLSVHNTARIKGKEDAPICSTCHKSHDIEVTAMTMKMKDKCLECHKDAEKAHKKWLSNPPFKLSSFAEHHLNKVACALCHSPGASGGVYLCLYDQKTKKPFSKEDVLKLLETDSAGLIGKLDTNRDGSIDAPELWSMVKQLNEKGADVTLTGRMDVRKGTEAHQIAVKKEAVRECERCHRTDSDFFKEVSVVLLKSDGRPRFLSAKQGVLTSVLSILPVSEFYALGGTRLGLLDIVGTIAVLGGIAFALGHITIRIITSPIRSLRKMGKGGKE